MKDEQLDFELQDVPSYILNCPVVSNWIEVQAFKIRQMKIPVSEFRKMKVKPENNV